MLFSDLVVIGGGPAGMSAALAAAGHGIKVTLLERMESLGGQLVKQTHRFFGSESEYAGTRGIRIADILREKVESNRLIDCRRGSTALGIYEDGVVTFEEGTQYKKVNMDRLVVATGASEKMLVFEGNDLPGVYGAGAVQTLMNLYGVLPGRKVLMVGAGNIGLIVTYQLLQAGVRVAAIVDAADHIGGYLVHASKVRRCGVPVLLGTTIRAALGTTEVEGAIIQKLDSHFHPIPGTEQKLDVDTVCLSVGLSPLTELLRLAGCKMRYIPALGGFVPVHNSYMQTSRSDIFVAGDASCIEEASSAMMEGAIAGLSAAISLHVPSAGILEQRERRIRELAALRAGDVGAKIRNGLAVMAD